MKKLFFYLIIILGLLVFIYTLYKSEIIWDGTKRDYYLDFYIFSFVLIFLSIIYRFLNNTFKTYFIICFLTITFSFYTFEFLNLAKDLKTVQKIDYKKNLTKLEFYNELKKNDNNVGFSLGPNYFLNKYQFELFPFSGKSNSIIINCNEGGYYSTYESDRYGFNNINEIWEKEFIDYILVGDSYLEGACVNKPYDISSVLNLNSNKSFLNLAHGGNGPLISYSVIREYLKNKRFKNLIYFFSEGNDLENLNVELKNKILINYVNNKNYTQNLLEKRHVIDNISEKIIKNEIEDLLTRNEKLRNELNVRKKIEINPETKKYKINRALKLYYTRSMIFKKKYDLVYNPIKVDLKIEKKLKNILTLMKKLSVENNANFYIAYLPTWMRYNGFKEFDSRYSLLKRISSELSINFIDIHKEVFLKIENPNTYFVYGGNSHYNEKGYNNIAKYILDVVQE